jgi:hypothetical protein
MSFRTDEPSNLGLELDVQWSGEDVVVARMSIADGGTARLRRSA